MAELGEDDAAPAVRSKVHTRGVDRTAESAGHGGRVDESPGHAIDGNLDSGQAAHPGRRGACTVDDHVGVEARAALRGHASHTHALANLTGRPLPRAHAGPS